MAEHTGALLTFQVGASHMDAGNVYRSHFGSRYHTRADAVTQAFLLLLFDSRPSAALPSPQHVFPHPLPNTNTSALPSLLPKNAQTSAPTQKKLAPQRTRFSRDRPFIESNPPAFIDLQKRAPATKTSVTETFCPTCGQKA